MTGQDLELQVRRLLDSHWDDARGYCVPNPTTYPHLWLWDSCFHAIIWAHLGDDRALRELDATLAGQLPSGLVPHMKYGGRRPDSWLGPLENTSSLTQPPMFGHAANVVARQGFHPSKETLDRARHGLDWLWRTRRTDDGLIYVVHPWEAGNDHSPRWDDHGAPGRTPDNYSRPARTAWNQERVHDITFGDDGSAQWSSTFVVCPAAFNAYVAFNLAELAELLGDQELADRAALLSETIDNLLWDEEEQLWSDLPVVGGGATARVPTSDGVMPALVTQDPAKALASLRQLDNPDRFGAPYGPANVARTHPSYDPQTYWRGPAWPPLNYLFWLAAQRWELDGAAHTLVTRSIGGALHSGWAEYWNPENGTGLGAAPQTWTGLVIAQRDPAILAQGIGRVSPHEGVTQR
ncbi:MGH1-like glycoside hydrolase domain-containing protein [Kribbella sp. NPDC050241]|uniref:MGH1-like glycoside hydrolase domain-containing protein n=1 Tax=Kribbella sp. NPDC050241 TaxID=3364115 RepID=UPI0037BA9F2B